MKAHLDSAQFYDLLDPGAGPAPINRPEAQRHLAACEDCRAEFDSLHHALAGFRAAATNLALSHAPMQRSFVLPRRRFFTVPRAAWASGFVAAAALFTFSLSTHRVFPTKQPDQTAVTASTETAQFGAKSGVQSDDALLNGIDSDLSTSVPTALEPLEASPTAQSITGNNND